MVHDDSYDHDIAAELDSIDNHPNLFASHANDLANSLAFVGAVYTRKHHGIWSLGKPPHCSFAMRLSISWRARLHCFS